MFFFVVVVIKEAHLACVLAVMLRLSGHFYPDIKSEAVIRHCLTTLAVLLRYLFEMSSSYPLALLLPIIN